MQQVWEASVDVTGRARNSAAGRRGGNIFVEGVQPVIGCGCHVVKTEAASDGGGQGASGRLHHRGQRRHVFRDAPHPSINASILAHLDLDGFRFRFHGFREMHLEQPVFVVSRHLAPIRILWK